MHSVKYIIRGSDCIGAFASATDALIFVGNGLTGGDRATLADTLKAECRGISIANSNLIGVFMRGNSKGILLSNLTVDYELARIREAAPDLTIEVLDSPLNAIGNNIIANDRVAIVNTEYDGPAVKMIGDTLDVEVIRRPVGEFRTVGANSILTNRGLVINNRCSDSEKEELDRATGFDSVRTTANTGSLGIGISAVANASGVVVGGTTTGYELAKILEGLNIR
jgi:translation initiation factor 6